MTEKLIAILIMILAGAGITSAQEIVLPSRGVIGDRYASISKFDLRDHLPAMDLRHLPSPEVSEEDAMAADLLDYANTFLGLRYRRGGKTPAGFDCSGFTSYVFRQFGYDLSASSSSQYSDGIAVNRDDIRPGDLLFFKGRAAGSSRIGHVGIAISADPESGEITFIHSSCSSGISIDRVSAPYYSRRFVGARRVLGQ